MKALYIFTIIGCAAWAQDSPGRIVVPFSDPARPRMVTGSMNNGCFAIEGYDGKDVVIEQRGGDRRQHTPHSAGGLRRIEPTGMSLRVEEENNTVTIHAGEARSEDLVVKVPFATSLKLKCLNGGDISVQHVTGDLDLENLNGGVSALGVSGAVVAHSLNGRVSVSMDKVTPDKAMSFTTLNGNIDVTLPGDTKGLVRMKSDNGEIYSDFDIKLNPSSPAPVVEDGRAKGGKYRVKIDSTTVGAINGGGPDLEFKTYNGNIYIRKKK